jgi:DNA modification methylase
MASKIAIKNRIKELRYVTAQELEPHPLQHRLHPDKQKQALDAALREIGIADALLAYEVDGKLRLIDGHGRREVAPDTKWPVLILDVNDAEAKQILAQHDALAGLAEVDAGALDALLREVSSGEEALQALFSEMATDAGLYQDEQPGKGGDDFDVDAAMPQGETRAQLGDIWQLGRHRVLCGDSTDAGQVQRLMQGEKAAICFTSPPYNAGKTPTEIKMGMNSKYLNDQDNKPTEDYTRLLLHFTEQALAVCSFVFVNIQMLAGNKLSFVDYLTHFKHRLADIAVWDKTRAQPAMAMNVMNSQYEFILIFSSQDKPSRAIGTREYRGTVANVYSAPPQTDNDLAGEHSATFPIHLPEWAINNFAERGDVVYEPFCGSGTTLIACERTNRQCRGIELEPRYVDVILARWEAETGKEARLLERIS